MADRPTGVQREHAAILQRAFQFWVGRDIEGLLDLYSPDVIVTARDFMKAGPFQGHAGFMELLSLWNETWGAFDFDVQEIEPVGQRHVVATVMVTGGGRAGNGDVKRLSCWVAEIRTGLVAYLEAVNSPERAREIARSREAEGA
jgi:ketosteroid isomerase-like protein